MSDTTTFPEFKMDSKVVIAIIAVTATTIAAIVCTRKYFLDKKQPTSPEKRILRRKQRSMMKTLASIEDDAKKMLNDIRKVQEIILNFMKNDSGKEQESDNNEKTVIENDVDNDTSIDTSDSAEKTVIDTETKEEGEEEEKVENKEEAQAPAPAETASEEKKGTGLEALQAIRVDGFLIEMKIKGLDEFLLRLLEQLDSLRPNALMDEAREMCAEKEGLEDVIPYIEHKVEKIKKMKKSLVVRIQKYLDNVDKLASTVSGKNKDIEVVESVAKLWEVKDEEAAEASNDDDKKNN